MVRKVVEPETREEGGPLEGTITTHPAFGQVTVSKISGQRTLYGSDFVHGDYVRICLYESELKRGLSRDWYYQKQRVAEFDLSEAQWASFVSSFGLGSGVPCTINLANGTRRPEFPLRDSGQEYKVEADKTLNDSVNQLRKLKEKVTEGVQGLSKTRAAEILQHVDKAISDLTSSLPFVANSFAEHMEERVEKAKVEVNAYLNNTIVRAGLKSLGADESPVIQIDDRHSDSGSNS